MRVRLRWVFLLLSVLLLGGCSDPVMSGVTLSKSRTVLFEIDPCEHGVSQYTSFSVRATTGAIMWRVTAPRAVVMTTIEYGSTPPGAKSVQEALPLDSKQQYNVEWDNGDFTVTNQFSVKDLKYGTINLPGKGDRRTLAKWNDCKSR